MQPRGSGAVAKPGRHGDGEAVQQAGRARDRGAAEELGPLGAGRPAGCAQLRRAGGHRRRGAAGAPRPGLPAQPAPRSERAAGGSLGRPLEPDPHHARDRHRRGRRQARRGPGPALRRRCAPSAGPVRDPLRRAFPHLPRRADVERLRRPPGRRPRRQEMRHRACDRQDGRPWRPARRRPREGRGLPRGRLSDHDRGPRADHRGRAGRGPARRLPDHPHRPDGGPAGEGRVGPLCRRRGAGPGLRDLRLAAREGDRDDLQRHLGHRGPAQRGRRPRPAAALGHDPGDGRDPRRDVLRQGAGGRLRRRPRPSSSSSPRRPSTSPTAPARRSPRSRSSDTKTPGPARGDGRFGRRLPVADATRSTRAVDRSDAPPA